jgi:uncharacterized protein
MARLNALTQPYGWLSLTGLHFLEAGSNTLGSAEGNTIRLSGGPATVGTLDFSGGRYRLTAPADLGVKVDGATIGEMDLKDDASGPPSVIEIAGLRATIVQRGKPALRVRDPDAPTRLKFRGLDAYAYASDWSVDARFEAYDPPRTIDIATVIGTLEQNVNPGRAVFERDGVEYALEAIQEAGSDQLFFIVGDRSNARETYGAGRFLYTALPKNDRVTLDFNRLYNPPCAFTEFSTCPLPPEGNRLKLKIEAGEKRYEATPET